MDTSERHDMEAHRRKFLIAGAAGFGMQEFNVVVMPSPVQPKSDGDVEIQEAVDRSCDATVPEPASAAQ